MTESASESSTTILSDLNMKKSMKVLAHVASARVFHLCNAQDIRRIDRFFECSL